MCVVPDWSLRTIGVIDASALQPAPESASPSSLIWLHFVIVVKTWDDPEIKALNPGVSLPSTTITVIHRSDSSGTTSGFTGFLAAVDPEFKSKVGEGKDVQWPTGTGAKGNAGVAGASRSCSDRHSPMLAREPRGGLEIP
jgi:phosphate transport system substrate-binding protein